MYGKRPYEGGGGGRGGYGGGGGRGGYGGGGGRGGFGGGGGRGGGYNNVPQKTEEQVITNRWKLVPVPTQDESDYMQYQVIIKNGWFKRVQDEATGEETRVFESREITKKDMEKVSKTAVPWKIMKKLVDEHNLELAYDGNQKAYSTSAKNGPVVGKEYPVKVKRDCEDNDPDAERVKDRWYAVIFHATKSIPYADVTRQLCGEMPPEEISIEISTMFNVIMKSNAILTKGMISLEPNSAAVFFPLQDQSRLLNNMADRETRDKTKILLSGLEMNVMTQRGVFVQIESAVKYANKEYWEVFQDAQRHRGGASRVPLLNTEAKAIAGVKVGNLDRPITENLKKTIEEAIVKLGDINISFTSNKNKPGKDGAILYKNKPFRKDRREDDSRGHGQRIILSANDPTLYSFTVDDQETTVASYFETRYGIKLQYPNMPIIYVDDISKRGGGWYPIELAYQAFAKAKDNNEDIVSNILKYHDAIAGKRYITEVESKLELLQLKGSEGVTFRDRLMKWRVQIERSPVEETAKVLKPPRITFKNSSPASIANGSFNMIRVQFSKPAKLASFAVVNFTNRDDSCYDFVKTALRVAESHGIEIPSTTKDIPLHHVAEHYHGRDAVGDALETAIRAIQKAKNVHLFDTLHLYRKNNVFFHTYCYSEQQEERECLVLPPIEEGGRLGLLLNYEKSSTQNEYFSHRVTLHNGDKQDVRLMVKIEETETLIDPLDFRYQNGFHQALREDGSWNNVKFVKYCYISPKGFVSSESDIQMKSFYHFAEDFEVDFPSIVFVYLPDDGKALYDRIKAVSNFVGVQSQCAVMTQFNRQKNKDQYASNIATKLNAKLSTVYDKAISWNSLCDEGNELTWVGELPTLVIGVGIVHGMFKSIVAASVYLDSGCMRLSNSCFIQKKSDCISDLVMKDIIEVSIDHYVIENKRSPERILFFRDGISDGNFRQAHVEIQIIRRAAEGIVGDSIPITFVICQSQQQGFKMVPRDTMMDFRGRPMTNVGSGTVLQSGNNSYYLIAQGGLKGTSKPVKHIVILNENENVVKGRNGLTLQNLMNCTYQMCFKYPTATKAVRELPAIKYAKKLANQVLSEVRVLENGINWFSKNIRLVLPADDTGTEEEQRPYLELRNSQGTTGKEYNIVRMPFRNHLAA